MATVLKMNNAPVSMAAAFYSISVMQEAVKNALPETSGGPSHGVSVRVEPSGAFKVEIAVGGPASLGAQTQQSVLFMIEKNMIPGYKFTKPQIGFEHGKCGRRTITALVVVGE